MIKKERDRNQKLKLDFCLTSFYKYTNLNFNLYKNILKCNNHE